MRKRKHSKIGKNCVTRVIKRNYTDYVIMRKKERKIERRKREIYRKGKEKEKEITEKETLEKWAKTV